MITAICKDEINSKIINNLDELKYVANAIFYLQENGIPFMAFDDREQKIENVQDGGTLDSLA